MYQRYFIIFCFALLSVLARRSTPPLALELVARPEAGGTLLLTWESTGQAVVIPEARAVAEGIAAHQQGLSASDGMRRAAQHHDDDSQRVKEGAKEQPTEHARVLTAVAAAGPPPAVGAQPHA